MSARERQRRCWADRALRSISGAALLTRARAGGKFPACCEQQQLGTRAAPAAQPSAGAKVLLIGGTGAVGSAAAIHMLQAASYPLQVVLAGRDSERGARCVRQGHSVEFQQLDWRDGTALEHAIAGATAVVHTAGPYAGQEPGILAACIAARVPCYVDLSDPLEYIDAALGLSGQAAAQGRGTMALLASGAFPGFSNLLGAPPPPPPTSCFILSASSTATVECASRLEEPVADLSFRYFTAGLGGSGPVNLLITNQGFGEPVSRLRAGRMEPAMVSGLEAERVKFYIDETDESAERVGERTVWSWPFPE
eukprot:jgi/Tetstr1/456163/TSEL_042931.t1